MAEKAWIYVDVHAEGYFEVTLQEGQTPQQAAIDVMEDGDWEAAADSSYWMKQLLDHGIVGVSAVPVTAEDAQAFLNNVAVLKKPHNPDDFVEMKRPERK